MWHKTQFSQPDFKEYSEISFKLSFHNTKSSYLMTLSLQCGCSVCNSVQVSTIFFFNNIKYVIKGNQSYTIDHSTT